MTTRFSSYLAEDMEHFLEFKHALGNPYQRGEFTLHSFDRYVLQHAGRRKPPLENLIYKWLSRIECRKAVTVATDLGVIRQFCLFRRRRDPGCFVPGREWAPQSTESRFLPYIFSLREIRALLESTMMLRGPQIRKVGIRTLMLTLYCTGMRLGEALRLNMGDVDMENRVFIIRAGKSKQRMVPFRRDLARELLIYLHERRRTPGASPDGAFLIRANGRRYRVQTASWALSSLLRRTGLKPPKGRVGPRPYDFRHTYAVHRLTRWYRSGVDIHAHLPWLSAYMGHENILGTELYLNATPELLAIAGRRFENRLRGRKDEP